MNFADIIVSGIIIGLLILIFYATRNKKKSGCGSCSQDCSSCQAFTNFYKDYKQDHRDEKR